MNVINGSTIHYRPLINLPPADPSTVLSSMVNSQNLDNEFGQQHKLLTGDQQIHKVTVNVKWQYDLYPILGGMHTEISSVGCIGHLMAGSVLAEFMKSSFGSVEKKLSGKQCPSNIRALRIVIEVLLEDIL